MADVKLYVERFKKIQWVQLRVPTKVVFENIFSII